jgi:hypothetical protein
MVPLPASLHPRRGRAPEDDDEPHPEAASSARGPDLIEEAEQPPSGASGSDQPEYVVLDSFVDGGDTTQVIHCPVRFIAKTPAEGVDVMQDLIGKDSNGRAFWVIGCVTEGAVLDRLAGASDETTRAVLDWLRGGVGGQCHTRRDTCGVAERCCAHGVRQSGAMVREERRVVAARAAERRSAIVRIPYCRVARTCPAPPPRA